VHFFHFSMPDKPRQTSPAAAWCLTLNNWTQSEHEFLSSAFSQDESKLFIIGKEIGEEGTPHLQGYVCSKNPKKKWRPLPQYNVMRNNKQCGSWRRAKKCADANYHYCSKDGDFITNMDAPIPKVPKVPRGEVLQAAQDRFDEVIDYENLTDEEITTAQKRKEAAAKEFLFLQGEWDGS